MVKYLVVTGGVISGVGKGIVTSSIGMLLKAQNFRVTAIKIDPYLNIDAGTMSPYEHGECFVLEDGTETDLDLGNYERFLNISLTHAHSITTGKVYQQVIERERRGDYLGSTVQIIPHLVDQIIAMIQNAISVPVGYKLGDLTALPEICLIELGGTIGDIESMPFVEALRQLSYQVGEENICCLHVCLLPRMEATGEFKTKPIQHSVKTLRSLGLSPHLICVRSSTQFEDQIRQKISNFCQVPGKRVLTNPDTKSIYQVPFILREQEIIPSLLHKWNWVSRPENATMLGRWRGFMNHMLSPISLSDSDGILVESITIGIVGKYITLKDSYLSITHALQHASFHLRIPIRIRWISSEDIQSGSSSDPGEEGELDTPECPHFQQLSECHGIVIPGGFGFRGVEGMQKTVEYCRRARLPYLGICLGFQTLLVNIAQAEASLVGAASVEIEPTTPHPIIVPICPHPTESMGASLSRGLQPIKLVAPGSSVANGVLRLIQSYQKQFPDSPILERHRHRYQFNMKYLDILEQHGIQPLATSPDGGQLELVSWSRSKNQDPNMTNPHPFCVATQFHPEFSSRPEKPHPIFIEFLRSCREKLR